MNKNDEIHQHSKRQFDRFYMVQTARSTWLKSLFKSGLALYKKLSKEINWLGSVGIVEHIEN